MRNYKRHIRPRNRLDAPDRETARWAERSWPRDAGPPPKDRQLSHKSKQEQGLRPSGRSDPDSFLARMKRWSDDVDRFEALLRQEESGAAYYGLAQVLRRGYTDTRSPLHQQVIEALENAMSFLDCPEEAVLQWEKLAGRPQNEGTVQRVVEVMEQVLARHPFFAQVRMILVSLLVRWTDDLSHAAEVLAPLLSPEVLFAEAAWWNYWIQSELGHLDKALAAVDLLARWPVPDWSIGLGKLRGDLLLQLGQPQAAIAEYTREVERGDTQICFLGLLDRAYASLLAGDRAAAAADADRLAEVWLAIPDLELPLCAPFCFDPGEGKAAEDAFFTRTDDGDMLQRLCQALAEGNPPDVSPLARGALLHIWSRYVRVREHDAWPELFQGEERDDEDANRAILRQAIAAGNNPKMGYDAAVLYGHEGRYAEAVRACLDYSCWYAVVTKGGQGVFYEPFYAAGAVNTAGWSPSTRQQVHAAAWAHLTSCSDADLIVACYFPFYRDFWRRVLQEGRLYDQVAATVAEIVDRLPPGFSGEKRDLLDFDLAWALQWAGNLDQAEQIYHELLARQPDGDPVIWYNLALIHREQGHVGLALALAECALQLDPENEEFERLRTLLLQEEEAADPYKELT